MEFSIHLVKTSQLSSGVPGHTPAAYSSLLDILVCFVFCFCFLHYFIFTNVWNLSSSVQTVCEGTKPPCPPSSHWFLKWILKWYMFCLQLNSSSSSCSSSCCRASTTPRAQSIKTQEEEIMGLFRGLLLLSSIFQGVSDMFVVLGLEI